MHTGYVKALRLDRGFGFIRCSTGEDVFFHATVLEGVEFDEQLREREVRFELLSVDGRGPRAKVVRPIN